MLPSTHPRVRRLPRVSLGLRIGSALAALAVVCATTTPAFADVVRTFTFAPHEVDVQRGPDGLVRFADLPAAFDSLQGATVDREWRVHFHVPIFLDRLAPFASTQSFVREVLAIQRARPVSAHLEVETYTWGMLPEPFRSGTVDEAVARELAWVRRELGA